MSRIQTESKPSDLEDWEIKKQSEATLKRLLATPPDHKRNVKSAADPKKRGRPPKVNAGGSNER